MIRKLAWIAVIAAGGAWAAQQVETPAPKPPAPKAEDLPKADTILDHFIEVTGGKAAYEARKGEITTGTFEMAAQGLKGPMTAYAAPPDKSYSVMKLEGIGDIQQGTENGIAWDNNPMLGPRVKTGDEKAEALREAAFNGQVDWRSLYDKAETVGVDTIDGEECYKVVLTPAVGKPVTTWFQKKSGLAVKRATTAVTAMGEVPVEVILSDYKNLGGVLQPTKMVQKAAGQEVIISIASVKTEEIPADKFDPPAEVKAKLKQ